MKPGSLARPPHPTLARLLYDPGYDGDLRHTLPRLLEVDAAHVVMLADCRILAGDVARRLLDVNRELAAQVAAGAPVLARTDQPHRGLYLRYEREYVARLGPDTGGAAHAARSRNDINATVTRMRFRDELDTLAEATIALARTLLATARTHRDTVICGFTHRQPAQPTTLGHYLAGVLAELARTLHWLGESYALTNRCPLGAAAGFGTAFPIDPARTASLLGFDGAIANASDAVASRDFAVHAVAALASFGVLLTRVATDLQEWAGAGYELVTWPDDLVSTSSIMPQKRNPFVLENVRGRAAQCTGALVNVLVGLKGAPWTNSVEVSAEATAALWPACDHARVAATLAELLIANLVVTPARARALVVSSGALMTALADLLVARGGLAFRTAHELVGNLVAELPPGPPDPADLAIRLTRLATALLGRPLALDAAALAAALDPDACVAAAAYGGGPAPDAVGRQLATLEELLAAETARVDRRRYQLAAGRAQLADGIARLRGTP